MNFAANSPANTVIKLFEGNITDTAHLDTLAYQPYQLGQTKEDKHYPLRAKPETRQNAQEQEKVLSALEEIASPRHGKTQQSSLLPEPLYEYLTLEIPLSPTEGIRVLGCSHIVGLRFSMRSALLLTTLRDVATLLRYSIAHDEQAHFDRIFREASAQLRNFASDSKTRHKRHTCRSLIKVLQRLEVKTRRAGNAYDPCSEGGL